jgi:PTH1 family peptidyl-tRNA hydrolase
MALFQRNPYDNAQHQPLFTLGMNKTVLLVGLGNPGKEFDGTRHNAGFMCLDAFAQAHDFDPWMEKKDLQCQLASKTLGDTRVILCKPTTFMNLSGEAVQKVSHFYKIDAGHTVVVHDELDIPFGQIRMRVGGSAAGHNGVESVIQHLGNEFGRVRIGIASEEQGKMDGADFVLAKFSEDEQAQLTPMSREVTSILTEYIFKNSLTPETRTFII